MEKTENNFLQLRYVLPLAATIIVFALISQKIPNYTVITAQNATSSVSIKDDQTSITILAVGDIMLGRHVELLMSKEGDGYPFKHIAGLLKEPDLVLANLEGPVVKNHKRTPSMSTHFEFDIKMPKVLADHSIDIVSLANNHTFDLGGNGYAQTVQYLKDAGVEYTGHPYLFNNNYVLRKEVKGYKLIFVGFNITNPKFDFKAAQDFVSQIKREKGDFLIATIHGGDEYELTSNTRQKNFYRRLLESGVDTVIAHHPHVVQEVEVYEGKAIFYSLGNFIFDQYFSKDVQEELAVRLTLSKDSVQYDLIPLRSIASQPRVMNEIEKKVWLTRLAQRSTGNIEEGIMAGSLLLSRY